MFFILCVISILLLASSMRLTLYREWGISPYLEGVFFSLVGSMGYQSTYGQLVDTERFLYKLYGIALLGAFFYLVYVLIYSISSNYLVQVYFSILVSVCIVANKMKVSARGEIILWSDFKTGLVKDVVWDMVLQKYWWLVLLIGAALLAGSYVIVKKIPYSFPLKKRGKALVISVVLLSLFLTTPVTILTKLGIIIYPNNNEENLTINGPGLMFFISKEGTIMLEPDNYSQKKMEELSKEISSTYSNVELEGESGNQPTFIYILSEAFYDPTAFEGTQWKKDPMPTIRSLQTASGGYMLTNVFGGGTANTEYSVLSNFSHNLLNAGSLPYSYIYENPSRNNSEISFFNELGYKTSAIHPYTGSSYNRTEVFESLGFDEFISLEDMSDLAESEGWVSDEAFFDLIIQNLTDEAQFIHGISMQNHYEYTVERKGELKDADNLLLNAEGIPSGNQLALYARGINETDRAVESFLKKLSEYDKEIYVVFYGDHLPSLDNALYENVRLTTNSDQELAKYMTPYFIWNNKGVEVEVPEISNPEFITLPAIMDSGIAVPEFYLFVNDLRKQVAAYNEKNNTNIVNGEKIDGLSIETEKMLEYYRLIMYDRLSGNNYSKNLFNVKGEKYEK